MFSGEGSYGAFLTYIFLRDDRRMDGVIVTMFKEISFLRSSPLLQVLLLVRNLTVILQPI